MAAIDFQIGADNSVFRNVLNQTRSLASTGAGKITSSFNSVFQSFGGFGTLLTGGGILAGAKSLADFASEVNDTSASLGISTDTLQEFTNAVELAGGSGKALQQSMAAIIQAQARVQDENATLAPSFARLGITLQNLRSMSPDQILLKLADALHDSGNDGTITAAVMDVLGKKVALKLIPSLREGSEAFLAMGRSSTIMSSEAIGAVDAAQDRFDTFIKNYKATITGGLGELLSINDNNQWQDFLNTLTGLTDVNGKGLFGDSKVKPLTPEKDPNALDQLDVSGSAPNGFFSQERVGFKKPAFQFDPGKYIPTPGDGFIAGAAGKGFRGGGADMVGALGGLSGLKDVATQGSLGGLGARGYASYGAEKSRLAMEATQKAAAEKAKAEEKGKSLEGTNTLLSEVKAVMQEVRDKL